MLVLQTYRPEKRSPISSQRTAFLITTLILDGSLSLRKPGYVGQNR